MSAEKGRLTYSSAARASHGIFSLSNVFFPHPSSNSGYHASRVSFEGQPFSASACPQPVISCFKPLPRKSAKAKAPPGRMIDLSDDHVRAVEEVEIGFDSEPEQFLSPGGSPAPALCFLARQLAAAPGRMVLLKNLIHGSEQFRALSPARPNRRYVCKYCGDVFASGCAMGGHISKVHRGCSRDYRRKKIRSKAKKVERERARFLRKVLKPSTPSLPDITRHTPLP